MIKMRLVFIALLLVNSAFSQTHIEGYYSSATSRYVPKENITWGKSVFEVSEAKNGFCVIHKENWEGVIDTSGFVRIPLEYASVQEIGERPGYFKCVKDKRMHLVDARGSVLLKLEGDASQNKIIRVSHSDDVLIKQGNKYGIFNLRKANLIIPVEFDVPSYIEKKNEALWRNEFYGQSKGDFIILKRGKRYAIGDLSNGYFTPFYSDIRFVNDTTFFIRLENGRGVVTSDIHHIDTANDFNYVDALNEMFVVEKNGKYGVYDTAGDWVIPMDYDDIYFSSRHTFWLKKEGKWALSDSQHQLKTGFEFENVDQYNEVFYNQLIRTTRLDTAFKYVEREYAGINHAPDDLKQLLYAVEQLKGGRRLYSCLIDKMDLVVKMYAQKNGNWHFVDLYDMKVEDRAWDSIVYIPQFFIQGGLEGGSVGGKYYVSDEKRYYDDLIYDCLDTHFTCDKIGRVKKGRIYFTLINYSNPAASCLPKKCKERIEDFVLR
ncbi:MAG: WG repeat-containing protein [Flavobacteriales bacterium]